MATCLRLKFRALFCAALLTVPIASCSPLQTRQETVTDPRARNASRIPPDVALEILQEEARSPNKRSLTVRLSRKVSESELALIAAELRSRDAREFERTFICYFLPGMTIDAGAWATSHFDPALKVEILGIPPGGESASVATQGSARIATWSDEVMGGLLTLLKSENGLEMRMQFKDKSVRTRELVESKVGKRRRLDPKEKSRSGDYYVIAENGLLELWDSNGLIRTAAPMKER